MSGALRTPDTMKVTLLGHPESQFFRKKTSEAKHGRKLRQDIYSDHEKGFRSNTPGHFINKRF